MAPAIPALIRVRTRMTARQPWRAVSLSSQGKETKKMKRLIALCALVVAAASVAASAAQANHMEMVGPAGVTTSTVPFDQQFIDVMAAHHKMAIQMAQMALMKGKHPDLKALARQVIAAQSKEIGEFHQLRKRWYGSATFTDYGMNEMMMRSMGMAPNMMTGLMRTSRFD